MTQIIEIDSNNLEWSDQGVPSYEGSNFTGVALDYWDNGVVRRREFYKNGILHGDTLQFDSLGAIVLRCRFCEGQTHGEYWERSPHSEKLTKAKYEHGICLERWVAHLPDAIFEKQYDIREHPEALRTLELMRLAQKARKHSCEF